MKAIHKVIKLDMFGAMHLYVGDTTVDSAKQLEADWGESHRIVEYHEGEEPKGTSHFFKDDGDPVLTIVVPKNVSIATMSHECLHIAYRMIDHFGIYVEERNHEILAMVQGFLFEKCMEVIDKIRK